MSRPGYLTGDLESVVPATVPMWALLLDDGVVVAQPVVAWGVYVERLVDEPNWIIRNVRALVASDDDSLAPAGVPTNFCGLVSSLDYLPSPEEAAEWIAENRA